MGHWSNISFVLIRNNSANFYHHYELASPIERNDIDATKSSPYDEDIYNVVAGICMGEHNYGEHFYTNKEKGPHVVDNIYLSIVSVFKLELHRFNKERDPVVFHS